MNSSLLILLIIKETLVKLDIEILLLSLEKLNLCLEIVLVYADLLKNKFLMVLSHVFALENLEVHFGCSLLLGIIHKLILRM